MIPDTPAEMIKSLYYAASALVAIGTVMLALLVMYLRSYFPSKKEVEDRMGKFDERLTAQSERLNKVDERLNRGDDWFDRIDERIKSLPDREAITALVLSMERYNGDLRVAVTKLEAYEAGHKLLRDDVNTIRDALLVPKGD